MHLPTFSRFRWELGGRGLGRSLLLVYTYKARDRLFLNCRLPTSLPVIKDYSREEPQQKAVLGARLYASDVGTWLGSVHEMNRVRRYRYKFMGYKGLQVREDLAGTSFGVCKWLFL